MDDLELRELQDPENWEDLDNSQRTPVRAPRAVVSVSMSREELGKVSEAARHHEMKTSEFIRHAALVCAAPVAQPGMTTFKVSHAQGVVVAYMSPSDAKALGRVYHRGGTLQLADMSYSTA